MSEQPARRASANDQPPPTRAQRLAAFGFLGAFGLTIITVLLTGLSVGAPSARHVLHPVPPAAESGPANAERPSGSSSTESTPPEAPRPRASESRATDNASHADSAHDREDEAQKDARRRAEDSRANDAR